MYKRILVPVDGSAVSLSGLNEAIRLAKNPGAKLRILHVVDGITFGGEHGGEQSLFTANVDQFRESGRRLMDEVVSYARKKNVRVESELVENLSGRAAESIVKVAKKWPADVIVMGTHGRRGINRLVLGSDAEIVIRSAPVPVLLVRSAKPAIAKRRRVR